MSKPMKPHEKNQCAFFSSKTCDKCRANQAFRLNIGGVLVAVYCARLAANLMGSQAQLLQASVDIKKMEKLIRVAEEKVEKKQMVFLDDEKPEK